MKRAVWGTQKVEVIGDGAGAAGEVWWEQGSSAAKHNVHQVRSCCKGCMNLVQLPCCAL